MTDFISPNPPTPEDEKLPVSEEPTAPFTWWEIALWMVLASLVIGLYTWEVQSWSGIYSSILEGTDMEAYYSNALGILAGTWPGSDQVYFRAPLYNYLLGGMMALVGEDLSHLLWIQGVFMALAVVFTTTAVSQILGRWYGHIAGVLFLSYGGAVYWSVLLHSATMEIFLTALSLWSLVWFRAQPVPRRAVVFGGLAGLVCLIRPNFLLIWPLILAGMAVHHYKKGGRKSPAFRHVVLAGLAFLVPIAVPSLRNTMIRGEITSFSMNGKKTFIIANSTDSQVYNFSYPKGEPMSVTSLTLWKHMGTKAFAYWKCWEYPQNVNFYIHREQSKVLQGARLNHGILGALVILATVVLAFQWTRWWPYLVLFWGYYATVVAFFIIGRFRVTVVPVMCLLVAGLIREAVGWWHRGEREKVAFVAFAGLILFLLSQPWTVALRMMDRQNYFTLAVQVKDIDEARQQLRRWHRATPPNLQEKNVKMPLEMLELMDICLDVFDGKTDRALSRVDRLVSQAPHRPSVWLTARSVAREAGDMKKSYYYWRRFSTKFRGNKGLDMLQMLKTVYGRRLRPGRGGTPWAE